MYRHHLILPLSLLFYHSVFLARAPNAFSGPSEAAHGPSPTLQGELEGLQGCAFMCLRFLWSLCVKPGKNQRWCQDQQQDSGIECMKINCLSQQRNTLSQLHDALKTAIPVFSMCRLMMSNHWKGIAGLLIWNLFFFFFALSPCVLFFLREEVERRKWHDSKNEQKLIPTM